MTDYEDPRPIMKAMIGQLEEACKFQEWKCDIWPDMVKPPQWVIDTRRTLNEAKQFVAMLDGIYGQVDEEDGQRSS